MRRMLAMFIAFVCVAALPLRIFALDFDPNRLHIEFENAPESTEYIDLLVKMDRSDSNWLDFGDQPQRFIKYDNGGYENVPMPIGEDSEIAMLDRDGYVSFSMHNALCEGLVIGKSYMHLELSCSAEELFDAYSWRAAYVDAQGNVLGITKKASRSYDMHEPYALVLKDDKLKFRIWGISTLTFVLMIAVVLGIFALVIYLVFVSVRFVVGSKKYLREYAEDEKRVEDERRRR